MLSADMHCCKLELVPLVGVKWRWAAFSKLSSGQCATVVVQPCPREPQSWDAVEQSAKTTKRTVSDCTISVPQASLHSHLYFHSTPSSQPLHALYPPTSPPDQPTTPTVHSMSDHRSENTAKSKDSSPLNTQNGDLCLFSSSLLPPVCACAGVS